ncbi:MAG TPA: hypothetical protein VKU19_10105 [Bryobacteraceae bacterium]|nr:hypothetical protein [Bryobacteraceae bacterium]
MAIGKAAGCLIVAVACAAAADAQFTVRHHALQHACNGVFLVNREGVSFTGTKGHVWSWKIQDIQEFQLSPRSIHILTYRDKKLRLGADEGYQFTGTIPADEVYAILRERMDQRLVAMLGTPPGAGAALTVPVKHLGHITGSEGTLAFQDGAVVYSTPKAEESRTWRYIDIENISSSSRFDLTITTLEKDFHFQLKQPLAEAGYNELWLRIEKKNGRIQ